jgi:Protein of unknown function (DUF3800)
MFGDQGLATTPAGVTAPSNSVFIYLDESGDLGFKFDASYGNGGSSRYLTIAAVCVPPTKDYLLDRLLRNMYRKYDWPSGKERKFVQLSSAQRSEFASNANELCAANPDIAIHAIVVKKQTSHSMRRQQTLQLHDQVDPH